MTYEEWLKNKKQKEQKEAEETRIKNTREVNGGKETYSEWLTNKRIRDVNEDYINTFFSDANTFFKTADEEFKGLGWGSASSAYTTKLTTWEDLDVKASNISKWLDKNKDKVGEDTYNSVTEALESYRSGATSILDSYKNARDYYSQWETEDAYNEWYEGYKAQQAVLEADDFEHYSQIGANIKNPSPNKAEPDIILFGKGYGGEEVGNVVTYSRDNAEALGFGEANGGGSYAGGKYLYTFMTDDEVAVYNYYLGKGDTEKASEYLASLENTLNQRQGWQLAENLDGHKFAEIIFGIGAGVEQFAYGVRNLDNYIKGTEADALSATQYAAPLVREDMDGGWGVLYDLANTTAHMLPSILVGSFTGGLGGALTLGASAMGNGYAEMRNLGYDEWQSRGYGFLVGASEAALQYALGGISKLGGKVTGHAIANLVSKFDNAIARTAITLGGNMASEGIEEAIQTILEPAFKSLMTGEEFEAPEWEDVWYSALLGALSAGVIEGVPTIAGEVNVRNQGANLKASGIENVTSLAELGKTFADGTEANRLGNKVGENSSAYQIGRLLQEVGGSLSERNIADVASDLQAKGMSPEEATKTAQWLYKAKEGGTYTRKQQKAYLEDDRISDVHRDLFTNEEHSVNKRDAEYAALYALAQEATKPNSKATGEVAPGQAEASAQQSETVSPTKNPTAKENATEPKFEASTDGKTKIGDMEVSIKEIASVKDGEVTLRLEDGSTVSASDVEYGSTDEALLYENVVHMNLNAATANAFVKGYDPSMTVEQYAKGFHEAYRYGEYGFPVQEMSTEGFSAMLTESQKSLAYNLGKTDGKYKVESKQAKIASTSAINADKNATKGTKKGKLHNNLTPTTERQRASLKALGTLAEALGIDIHTFASPVVNGNRQGANGWFDTKDGSIHIDLYAGASGEGTMLFTAAHELTHFIREWSPDKFKVFADFLLEQYGKKGVSVNALVNEQIEKAKRNGRDISYDTAYEEVIADSCEAMLADGDAIAKIAELKAKDKTLWEKIKDFITKLVARIKSAYEGMSPDSDEGRYVAEMLESAEKLKALWTEALVEASDNYTSAEKTLFDNGIAVDSKTESASLMSVRDVLNSEQQQKVAETLATRFDVTVEEAKHWISAETSLASLILNPKYSQYLDYVADPNEEAVKSNSDYPQGTVDFSNICKKRRDFTEVMNRVLRNFPNHVFEATDLAKIRTIMSKEGMEVACGICYVEDRRQLDSIVAQDFIDSLALYRQGSRTRPDGKAFNANQLKALKLIDGDTYIPTIYELISLEGRNSLKAKNPAMEEAWVKYNNARGMQSVRLLLNDAEYKRQILDYKPSVVKRKNDLGGLRIYSFSDLEMFHLIDIIQVITDSATVGLSLQGYTKVNEYAKAVKDTGEKLNRSLIPKGDLGYHVENGRIVLDYDTVEGIDVNHPDFFDNIDNPNVGNIVIGINATQIKAAMTSKFIDQIIPFHTGQSNEVLGEKGIATWENYKDFQSERDLSTGKKSSHQINIYTEVIQAAEAEGKPITNKVDFVNKFLEVCKENNLEPRFSEFLNVDENGDYIYTEGYHKFLVDFKTFDQNTGEYLPQMPVKPIFENKYITQLLKDYVKTQKKKDADFSKAIPKVLDRITNEIVNPKVKYSDRTSKAPTFYSYMGKVVDGIRLEKMGAGGVVSYLKGKGVKAEEIKWSGIEAFLEGKKSVTKAELQEFVAGSQLEIEEEISEAEGWNIAKDGENYIVKDKDGNILETWEPTQDPEDPELKGWISLEGGDIASSIEEIREYTNDWYGNESSRWSQYKIDGGTNYREMVFRLPDSTYSNRAMRAHWGQDAEGVLAHARIQDITTNDGKKMLFIEEIQSDWHNEGHQKGYSTEEYEDAVAVYDKLAEDYANKRRAFNKYVRSGEFRSDPDEVSKKKFDWLRRKMDEAEKRMQNAERDIEALKEKGMGDVPDAPFRTTYHEYVLKRLLRMAAEEGYDSIGWTPAWLQGTRWSEDYLEGYRIEYDQDIPSFLKKYGKKWGAKVGETSINNGEEDFNVWSMDIPNSMKDSVLHEGQVLYSDRYSYETLTNKPDMKITEVDDNVKHNRADIVVYALKNAESVGHTNKNGNAVVHVEDIDTDVIVPKRSLVHGLDRRMNTQAPVLIKIGEVLKNSIRINELNPRADEIKNSYVLVGAARNQDGHLYIASFVVNKYSNEVTEIDVLYSANAKKESAALLPKITDKSATPTDSVISIAQLLDFVNRYFPDILPESVLRHYGYDSRPDGKIGESALYSDRHTDSVSNRSLLANALESVAQNDIERNKLKQYKAKIDLINSEQAKLHELREKIKELSFAKGKRDTEAIKSLQFEANQTANRINTYDKQLLNLESTKALKDVLEREKAMARKRAEQKGKEALAAYRERASKTQRELMTRYQESRKKGIEGRKMTEMRLRIKSITSELNTLLLKPTAKKHIKEELRKEVANALSAINMDTVGAEERLAEINRKLQATSDPFEIEHLLESYNRISLQGEKLKGRLDALQSAYEKIKTTDDIELNLAYQEVIHNSIKAVADKVGNTSIRNMTLEQLEMVYDLYSMIRKTIRDANKSFKSKKGETIMQMAEAVNDQVRTVGGQPYKRNIISASVQRLGWTFLKPYVAFRTIGSITLTNMYKELRAGEDTFYGDVKDAQAFIEKQYEKHGYKSWDMKQTKTFTAKSGKNFDLTLEQMMTLYAYSRREQAHKHIIEGGVVLEDALIVEKNKWGIPMKYEVTTKDAFNLSEETFAEIANSLSVEQKAFVDEMQAYLSDTMGEKGNAVSMELLGVKLFKEKFYLPIKSSQYYMNFKAEEAGEVKLKSPAFSKETVQHANNPIVLHSFTDLWAEHINDMSMYHSFVLALEDFTRVYNYKTKTDAKVETMDTKATLETAYPGATKYISKFLKDLNGGVRGETVGWAEKLTSLAKKGSVLGSASVAIQQPSAVMRAMAYVNPKYFVATTPESMNLVKHKKDWEELKKYAPIAGIKEMGRFDVGMGQGTVDWVKSNKTLMNKAENLLSVAPAYMDEVTWVSIWNAVKRETVHTRKDLRPGSDEFLKVAGEKFSDVISLSQVYDSVFSRSDLMRNKSWIAKAVTAFMAEPTTTLNMLWDSWVQGKRTGSKKGFVKATSVTGGAVVSAIVLNSALKSIVLAMRDDDEDESYTEKYLEHFFGGLKDNLNPLTLVPFAKDIVSIFNGYDVERMDMALFSDLKNAIDAFESDTKTEYEKWSGLIGAVSAFFGVPVKNVERDIRSLITTVFGKTEGTTTAGILNAIEEGWTGGEKSNGQQLYEAMLAGDSAQIERVESRFENQQAINSAIRKALRENDSRIKEAAEARYNGDIAEYMRIAKAIIAEGNFKQDDIVSAINSEITSLKKGEGTSESTTSSNKVTSIYKVDDYYAAIVGRDQATAYVVKEDLIKTDVANGKGRDEAEADFNASFASHLRDLYDKGEITDYKAEEMLVNYGGKSYEDASSKVQYWAFKKRYPDYDLSEEAVKKYYNEVEPYGIGVDVYYDYSKKRAKCKGVDANGDGKTDSGSVKSEVMDVINSLPITYEQKDALYYLNGWSASTIWEAPWH